MNSSKFTWEKYIGNSGYSSSEVWNFRTNRPQTIVEEIGRCSASSLMVRPRQNGEAVMLRVKETNEEFWMHVLSDKEMGVESTE